MYVLCLRPWPMDLDLWYYVIVMTLAWSYYLPAHCDLCKSLVLSGVVGRERMGTAFPHKKLSGNGVPTREILGYIFLLLLPN